MPEIGFMIVEWVSGALAVAGVILNNYRLRLCFLLWMVSNTASAAIHAHGQTWGLCARDIVFLGLAFHGWRAWGAKRGKNG